jgi:hypothetical protein
VGVVDAVVAGGAVTDCVPDVLRAGVGVVVVVVAVGALTVVWLVVPSWLVPSCEFPSWPIVVC